MATKEAGALPILQGKLIIQAVLRLETGLHIGASTDFAPIGAIDLPFVRDPLTKQPIIPGSSIKGKLRTLLARSTQEGYWLQEIPKDPVNIQHLFGSAAEAETFYSSRLQFSDLRLTDASLEKLAHLELDTFIGEIKFENTINRLTAGATPRQIERVPAGAEFAFRLTYNVEREDELLQDMQTLADGLRLLQMDYLGGSGSRGYGRVSLHSISVEAFSLQSSRREALAAHLPEVQKTLEGSVL